MEFWTPFRSKRSINRFNGMRIFALGILMVFGDAFGSWNFGLSAGFGGMLSICITIGFGYLTLAWCISTVSKVIPFAGGAYGLARCSLGFYWGFVVGCCEMVQYILFTSKFAVGVACIFKCYYHLDVLSEICVRCGCIMAAVVIHLVAPQFVKCSFGIGMSVYILVLLVVFCIGSSAHVNLYKNALLYRPLADEGKLFVSTQLLKEYCDQAPVLSDTTWVIGRFAHIMFHLPSGATFFTGIEALSLAVQDTKRHTKIIPRSQMFVMSLAFVFAVAIVTVLSGLSPGAQCLARRKSPIIVGLEYAFNSSSPALQFLCVPPLYGALVGFMWAFDRLSMAINESNFLPCVNSVSNVTSRRAILLFGGAIASVISCLDMQKLEQRFILRNVALLNAVVVYSSQCVGYLMLSDTEGLQKAPLHKLRRIAAMLSMSIWALLAIAIIWYQRDDHVSVIIFSVEIVVFTIYYYAYGKMMQKLSIDEKKYLYPLHVLNYVKRNEASLHLTELMSFKELSIMKKEIHLVEESPYVIAENDEGAIVVPDNRRIRSSLRRNINDEDSKFLEMQIKRDEERERREMGLEDQLWWRREVEVNQRLDAGQLALFCDGWQVLGSQFVSGSGVVSENQKEHDVVAIEKQDSRDSRGLFVSRKQTLLDSKINAVKKEILEYRPDFSSGLIEDLENAMQDIERVGNESAGENNAFNHIRDSLLDQKLPSSRRMKPVFICEGTSQPSVRPLIVSAIEDDMHDYKLPKLPVIATDSGGH